MSYRSKKRKVARDKTPSAEANAGSKPAQIQAPSGGDKAPAANARFELAKIVFVAVLSAVLAVTTPKLWNHWLGPKNNLAASSDEVKNSIVEASASPASDVRSVFYHSVVIKNTGSQTAINAKVSIDPGSLDVELKLVGSSSLPKGLQYLMNPKDVSFSDAPSVRIVTIDRLEPNQTLILEYEARSRRYYPVSNLAVKVAASEYKELSRPGAQLKAPPDAVRGHRSAEPVVARVSPKARPPDKPDIAVIDHVAAERATPSELTRVNPADSDKEETKMSYHLDSSYRLTSAESSDAKYVWDAENRLTSMGTLPDGRSTTYIYDRLGKVESLMYVDRPRPTFAYDAIERPEHNVAHFTYDNFSRLVAEQCTAILMSISPDDVCSSFWSDASANPTAMTIAVYGELKPGKSTLMNTLLHYDKAGNVTSIADRSGQNAEFREISASRRYDPAGNVTSYTYDALGNRTPECTSGQTSGCLPGKELIGGSRQIKPSFSDATLYYSRTRNFMPVADRYSADDPISLMTTHLYSAIATSLKTPDSGRKIIKPERSAKPYYLPAIKEELPDRKQASHTDDVQMRVKVLDNGGSVLSVTATPVKRPENSAFSSQGIFGDSDISMPVKVRTISDGGGHLSISTTASQ